MLASSWSWSAWWSRTRRTSRRTVSGAGSSVAVAALMKVGQPPLTGELVVGRAGHGDAVGHPPVLQVAGDG
ncbi:hypothetical protein [Geodermatophilus sp. URMC 65]